MRKVKYVRKLKDETVFGYVCGLKSIQELNMTPSAEERKMQTEFFKFIDKEYPELRHMCYATPNGGKRSGKYGKLLKLQGLTKGVLDTCCAIPSLICKDSKISVSSNGLYIEFKAKGKKSQTSKEQKRFLKNANLFNYSAFVVDSVDEATILFKNHVNEFTKDFLVRLIDGDL